jgi:hypothetical protein
MVSIQDANPSGEEFGYLVSHSTMNIPRGASRYQIRDIGCVGKCVRKLPLPSSPLPFPEPNRLLALVGFKLFFTGARDHELDRVGVWFRGDDLHVAFRDSNSDDTFGYLVDFVSLPMAGFNVTTGIERGSARGFANVPLAPPPSHADFLLTGFGFNFRKDDQEILDLGMFRGNNNLTVFYGDNGGGEEFFWRVEWAHFGEPVIQHT